VSSNEPLVQPVMLCSRVPPMTPVDWRQRAPQCGRFGEDPSPSRAAARTPPEPSGDQVTGRRCALNIQDGKVQGRNGPLAWFGCAGFGDASACPSRLTVVVIGSGDNRDRPGSASRCSTPAQGRTPPGDGLARITGR
jgi:hypothetical protein